MITNLAAAIDMSGGFADFFGTIGLTGKGLVKLGIPAVLVVIAGILGLQAIKYPARAVKNASVSVGALFLAIILATFGNTLFSTIGA